MDSDEDEVPFIEFDFSDFGSSYDEKAILDKITSVHFGGGGKPKKSAKKPADSFDPVQFEKMLNNTIDALTDMRYEVDDKVRSSSVAMKKTEDRHKTSMAALETNLEKIQGKFRSLDKRISNVSHTAVRIGHTLEDVDVQKALTASGSELIKHFFDFNTGDVNKLDPIFRDVANNTDEELHKAAQLVQTLHPVCQSLKTHSIAKASELVAEVSNAIENQMLEKFHHAAEEEDTEAMKDLAASLLNFSGKNVISRYVFRSIQHLDRYTEQQQEKPYSVKHFKVTLREICKDVLATFGRELPLIKAVFTQPYSVAKAAVLRVVNEKIQTFLDTAVAEGYSSRKGGDYLKVLDAAYTQICQLAESLGQLLARTFTASSSTSDSLNLATLVEGVFVAYREDYEEREIAQLQSLLQGDVVVALVQMHEAAEEKDLVDQARGRLDSVHDKLQDKLMGRKTQGALGKAEKLRVCVGRALDLSHSKSMIEHTLSSLDRAEAFLDPTALPKFLYLLFCALLVTAMDAYLLPVLKKAESLLPDSDPKTEPESLYFPVVHAVNKIAERLDKFFRLSIVPRLSADSNTLTIAENRKAEVVGRVEQQLLGGLTRCLSSSVRFAQRIVSKQKPGVYKPRDESALMDMTSGSVFNTLADFLDREFQTALVHLEGRNLDTYLAALADRVYQVVVTHFQKFQVSTVGAALLTRDLKVVQDALRQYHVQEIDEKFEQVLALASVFFVTVDNIHALLTTTRTSKLSHAGLEQVKQFIKMRADFSVSKSKILAQLPVSMVADDRFHT